MKKVVTASVIAVALAYIFDNTYQSTKNAESAGQQVRNRLQGSDVSPEDDMLSTPSIYRDWVMVQKGYQSLRMMNDNDNFDAEEAHFNIYEESFSGEWHYFSECETKGCDGNIEYRDVYACPSCGQDDIEILIGDTCPDCGVVAEEVSKYAIFYCSDCDEDYTDMYNSEVQTASNKVRTISGGPLQLRKLTHDKDLKPEDAKYRLDISAENHAQKDYKNIQKDLNRFIKTLCTCKHSKGAPSALNITTSCGYCGEEIDEVSFYGSVQKSILEAEVIQECLFCDETDAEFIEVILDGYPELICEHCVLKGDMGAESFEASTNPCQDCGSPSVVSQAKPHPMPYLYFCENCFISRNPFMKGHLAESFAATGVCNCGSSCNCDCGCAESGVCNCGPSCPCNCGCGIGAESFGATVYRGKPMGELGYVERAMATKRMIESADIEQSILQLEAAIRMGLISEEAIMNQLRDKFGSE